jgi:hypothetical protein
MGLRDDRFWALTPRLFRLLQDRWYEHERRQDRRAGEMVAAIYNVNRDPKKSDIFKWDEFFPGRSPRQERPKRARGRENLCIC